MPVSFFDTNILVYIASGDAAKADRAEAAVAAGRIDQRAGSQRTCQCRAAEDAVCSWDVTYAFPNLLRGLLTVHPLTVETQRQVFGSPNGTASPYTTRRSPPRRFTAIAIRCGRKTCSMAWCSTKACASLIRFGANRPRAYWRSLLSRTYPWAEYAALYRLRGRSFDAKSRLCKGTGRHIGVE